MGVRKWQDRLTAWSSFCLACEFYHLDPESRRVDQVGKSTDEADALCVAHRARTTEGLCVLCGHRLPWVSPWAKSSIGCCELCFRVTYGSEAGDQVQERLTRRRKRAS